MSDGQLAAFLFLAGLMLMGLGAAMFRTGVRRHAEHLPPPDYWDDADARTEARLPLQRRP